MFFHLKTLDELAEEKCNKGLRKEVKNTASRVVKVTRHEVVINSYEEAHKFGYLDPNLTLTIVHISSLLLHYNESPEVVKQILEKLEHTGKTKLPEKILVKMLATRLCEIYEVIKKANKYLGNSQTSARKFEKPVFRKVQEVKSYLDLIHAQQYMHPMRKIRLRMNREILNKPELTDMVVSQAYDLHMIEEVQDES